MLLRGENMINEWKKLKNNFINYDKYIDRRGVIYITKRRDKPKAKQQTGTYANEELQQSEQQEQQWVVWK